VKAKINVLGKFKNKNPNCGVPVKESVVSTPKIGKLK